MSWKLAIAHLKFQMIPHKLENVIIQVICGFEGHRWTIAMARSIFFGGGRRCEGFAWAVISNVGSAHLPILGADAHMLSTLIQTDLVDLHWTLRTHNIQASVFRGGKYMWRQQKDQPRPAEWTPEMVESERKMWILHRQLPQFRATNLLLAATQYYWTFFWFNNSGQNVNIYTSKAKRVKKRVSMYSQFQTSELYFPGCPAKRLFRNVYLKPETGEGQELCSCRQKCAFSQRGKQQHKKKNMFFWGGGFFKSGANEGFGRRGQKKECVDPERLEQSRDWAGLEAKLWNCSGWKSPIY